MADIPCHIHTLPVQNATEFDKDLREKILGFDGTAKFNKIIAETPERTVVHRSNIFHCSYIIMRRPDRQEFLTVGPLLYERISGKVFDELFQRLCLPEAVREPLSAYYCNLKFIPYRDLLEDFCLLIANHMYGKGQYQVIYKDGDEADVLEGCWIWQNRVRLSDPPFVNLQFIEERYAAENALLRAVHHGDEAQAVKAAKTLVKKDAPPLPQNKKDLMLMLNTLLRKEAEAAGVHPIHIESFSNSNMQKIERLLRVEPLTDTE